MAMMQKRLPSLPSGGGGAKEEPGEKLFSRYVS